MKLFNEYKNKYIAHTIDLINRFHAGYSYTKNEIADSFMQNCFNEPVYGYIDALLNRNKEADANFELLFFDKNQQAHTQLEGYIPVRPLNIELVWLSNLLKDERIRLFLEQDVIDKLQTNLINMDQKSLDFSKHFDIRNNYSDKDDYKAADYINNFKIILNAIDKKSVIQYSNIALDDRKYENCRAIPFRIEYSTLENRFRVSMYSMAESRAIKANISRLYNVSDIEEQTNNDNRDIIESIESKKASEPLVIAIKDEKNVIERCFSLFSYFVRKAYVREDGVYILEVSYYEFDKDEVIRSVLSLGASAMVISPAHIRQAIKDRLGLYISLT